MSTKLYVGNLSYQTHDSDLGAHFGQAGEVVRCDIVLDRETGRSRGFGFVEMANEEGAKKAIEMFDGQDYEGRRLRVNEARPREERPPRRF